MRVLLLALACVFSSAVQAEVFKWVDDKGMVHYGDKQHNGSQAVEMQVDMTESAAPKKNEVSRDEKRRRVTDALEEDRLEKKESREKKKIERERDKRRCNQLKDKKQRFDSAGSLYKLDKDGNRVYMSAKEREKSDKRLNDQIKKYCR